MQGHRHVGPGKGILECGKRWWVSAYNPPYGWPHHIDGRRQVPVPHNALDLRHVLEALHQGLVVCLLVLLTGQHHAQLFRGLSLRE